MARLEVWLPIALGLAVAVGTVAWRERGRFQGPTAPLLAIEAATGTARLAALPARVGDGVGVGDPLRTGDGATLRLRAPDGGHLRLGESTQLRVLALVPLEVELVRGALALDGGKTPRLIYSREATVATAGSLIEIRTEGGRTVIRLAEGRAQVEGRGGTSVELHGGERIQIRAGVSTDGGALPEADEDAERELPLLF